jgi:hypothetical protein
MSGKWILDTNIIIGFVSGAEVYPSLSAEQGENVNRFLLPVGVNNLCQQIMTILSLLSWAG